MTLRLLLFMALSFVAHYFLLWTIPGFDIQFRPRMRTVEIEIVPSAIRALPPAPADKVGSSAVSKNAESDTASEPAITVPSIDIPDIKGVDSLDIKIPELNVSKLENTSRLKADKELLKELKSSSDEFQKANRAGKGVESDVTGDDPDARDFFVIKNMSKNRRITSLPEKPVFSLSTDTAVRIGFKVDKEGNTYQIILLNTTDSKIEALAIDFVRNLKFNAVLADAPESAEITLNFRVR